MKGLICFLALGFTSLPAFAQIPNELTSLIPIGAEEITLDGATKDGLSCQVNISSHFSSTFSTSISVDNNSRRFGSFQIGLGHQLIDLNDQADLLTAVSTLKADDQFSSDSRSTLVIQRADSVMEAVRVLVERKGLFGYKTEVDETCFL